MIPTTELNTLLTLPGLEELWATHVRRMADYGFDRLIYGATRYRMGWSLGDPEDFIILTNHGSDYAERFIAEGLYLHAPMIKWALAHDGACSWAVTIQMMQRDMLTPAERNVMEFNRSHGVTAGYSISFHSASPRTKAAIALTARRGLTQPEVDAIWAEHGDDIQALNTIVHLRILSLPYTAPGRALTPRQREVLGWVGDGKTVQDIALIMGLTAATVEKHLRLARDALCVETTAQTVLKAAFMNQIFVLEQ